MKRMVFPIVAMLGIAPAMAQQGPPFSANGEPVYRFEGYSSSMVQGDAGFVGLHSACQADFGPEARACFSEEFVRSTNIVAPLGDGAWVMPVIVAAAGDGVFEGGQGERVWGYDFAGIRVRASRMSCGGWSINSTSQFQRGLHVTSNGAVRPASCDSTLRVTCCTPQ